MHEQIANILQSLKGITGTGRVLSQAIQGMTDFLKTLEPGDFVRSDPPQATAAPIAYDLWYLYNHINLMARYYEDIDGDHFDYNDYISNNLGFLSYLPGLKPLKVLRDIEQISTQISQTIFGELLHAEYQNNGVYWINLMAWEFWPLSESPDSGSDGLDEIDMTKYCGYISIPIGQLGVMDIISFFPESDVIGYKCNGYTIKAELSDLPKKFRPIIQSVPEIFADITYNPDQNCIGTHIIENAYVIPEDNKTRTEIYAGTPSGYGDVTPKSWLRYWIKRDDTIVMPGEFICILCRPVTSPPHVWWFQESDPFIYAGNWVETKYMTSGVIEGVNETEIEDQRTYNVRINGCLFIAQSSDHLNYDIGDRVALLRTPSISLDSMFDVNNDTINKTSYNSMMVPTESNEMTEIDFLIIPMTFYHN